MLGIYSMTTSSEQTVARDSRESIEELADLKAEVLDARIEDSIILIDSHAQQESKIFMIDFVMEDGSTERVMYSQEGAEFDEFIPKEMTRMKTDAPEIGAGEVSSEIDLNDFGIEESKIKSASFLTENGNRFIIDIPQVALQSVDDGGGDGSGGDTNTDGTNTDGDGDPVIRIIQHNVGEASVIHGTGMVGTEVSVEPYIGVEDTTDFAALIKEGDEYNAIPIPEFFREYDLNNSNTLTDLNPPQNEGTGGVDQNQRPPLFGIGKNIHKGDIDVEQTVDGELVFTGTGKMVVKLVGSSDPFWISGDTNGGEVRLLESPDTELIGGLYKPSGTTRCVYSEIVIRASGLDMAENTHRCDGEASSSIPFAEIEGYYFDREYFIEKYSGEIRADDVNSRVDITPLHHIEFLGGVDSKKTVYISWLSAFEAPKDEFFLWKDNGRVYKTKIIHTNMGIYASGAGWNHPKVSGNQVWLDCVDGDLYWPGKAAGLREWHFYDVCKTTTIKESKLMDMVIEDKVNENGGQYSKITFQDESISIPYLVPVPAVQHSTSWRTNTCDQDLVVGYPDGCVHKSWHISKRVSAYDTLPGILLEKWDDGYFEELISIVTIDAHAPVVGPSMANSDAFFPNEKHYLFVEVTGEPITVRGTLERPANPSDGDGGNGDGGVGGTEDKGDKLIDIINAPINTPYQIIYDGRPVVSGMSSPDGKIVVWGFENTGEPKGGVLHLYENSLSDRAPQGTFVFDDLNQNTFHLDTIEDLVYTAHTYVAVDVSVDTTITDISLETTRLPENTDRVSKTLTHINENYVDKETAYIPVIPGYDTINLTINDVPRVLEYRDFLNVPITLSAERESTIKRGNPFGSILSTEATTGVTARFVAPSNGNLIASISETVSAKIEMNNEYTFTTAPPSPTITTPQNPFVGLADIYVNGVFKKTVNLGDDTGSNESSVSPAGSTDVIKTKKYTYSEHALTGTVSVPVSAGDFVEFYAYAQIDGALSDYISEGHELVSKSGYSNAIVEIKEATIIISM